MKKFVLAGLLFLLLILAGAFFLVRIETVEVTGNAWYTDREVEERVLTGRFARNSAYQFALDLLDKKQEIPFVEDYRISFLSPTQVEIIVYEKSIVGYVSYMSSCMYFDKDGIVVESTGEKLEGVPEITGLEFGSIVLYKKLPVADAKVFGDILNLTQVLSLYEIKSNRIHYDAGRHATLYLGDIDVVLGDSRDINGKIAVLYDVLPHLEGERGTLYLDSYDSTSANPMYTFKKAIF